jgi:hypothetical protein
MKRFGFKGIRRTAQLAIACLLLIAPGGHTQDLEFNLGTKASTPPIPIHLASGKVHIEARIGDWGGQWLLLDTGANMSILNWQTAEDHGLELRGHGTTGGAAGGNQFEYAFTELPSMRVENLELAPRGVAVIRRHTENANGHRSIGLVGADVMRVLVVDVDYPGRTIRFHDPAAFEYSGDGVVLPLTLDQNGKPHIQAQLLHPDGRAIAADLMIDTGGRGLLVLTRPFVEEHDLEATLHPPLQAVVGLGVGGPVNHHLARMNSLTAGDLELAAPIVELAPAGTTGAYARGDRSGVLGAMFLDRFRAIFDYPHKRLILEPGPAVERPFEYEGSGAFLVSHGTAFDGVEVMAVAPQTPAATAGLMVGDRILSIDGQPVAELGLDGVRALFTDFGRTFALIVERTTGTLELELKIRRLV